VAEPLQAGDRVVLMHNGERGTVLRVDGLLADIQLDGSVREKFVAAALKKIERMAEDAS
jgi:preprotein translocase subunit YajC